jgi:hypothetical protein
MSAKSQSYSTWFIFVELGRRGSTSIKITNTSQTQTTNSRYFYRCSSWLLTEKCRVCALRVAAVSAACWGLCWNLTLNDSIRTSKLCENCINTAFRLGDTIIYHYVFTSKSLCRLNFGVKSRSLHRYATKNIPFLPIQHAYIQGNIIHAAWI